MARMGAQKYRRASGVGSKLHEPSLGFSLPRPMPCLGAVGNLRPFAGLLCQCGISFFPAWMFGDPHITTLDGANYTFNGLGDFLLVRAKDGNSSFLLQGRTALTGSAQASNFIAFAAQYNSTSLGPIMVSKAGVPRHPCSPHREPSAQGPSAGNPGPGGGREGRREESRKEGGRILPV